MLVLPRCAVAARCCAAATRRRRCGNLVADHRFGTTVAAACRDSNAVRVVPRAVPRPGASPGWLCLALGAAALLNLRAALRAAERSIEPSAADTRVAVTLRRTTGKGPQQLELRTKETAPRPPSASTLALQTLALPRRQRQHRRHQLRQTPTPPARHRAQSRASQRSRPRPPKRAPSRPAASASTSPRRPSRRKSWKPASTRAGASSGSARLIWWSGSRRTGDRAARC